MRGVHMALANPVTGSLLVSFDPDVVSRASLEARVVAELRAPRAVDGQLNPALAKEHHHRHRDGVGGYILRLVAGGLALGGMLIHKFLFLPIGLPGGVAAGIGFAVTIMAGYPFFRGGIRSLARFSAGDTDTAHHGCDTRIDHPA